MLRRSLIGGLTLLLIGINSLAHGQTDTNDWRFSLQASVEEDLSATPGLLTIGTNSSATDGYEQGSDQSTLGAPADNPVFIASFHSTSETGYSGAEGIGTTVFLSSDIRAPIKRGGEKIWKVALLYNNSLSGSATMLLTWPQLSGMPDDLSFRIGYRQDFLSGGSQGINMRANRFATFKVTPYNAGYVEIHAKNVGPVAAPYISISTHFMQIQVGNSMPLFATTQNAASDPVWTTTGGAIAGSGSQIVWTAPSAPGTYVVTAVVEGPNGWTASDSTAIQVTTKTALDPNLVSFSPASGPVGTKVTLSGVGFAENPYDNAVTFQGPQSPIPARLDLLETASSTTLTVVVPPEAIDGPIMIATSQGFSASADSFHVLAVQTNPLTNIAPIIPRMGVPGVSIVRLSNPNIDSDFRWDPRSVLLFKAVAEKKAS